MLEAIIFIVIGIVITVLFAPIFAGKGQKVENRIAKQVRRQGGDRRQGLRDSRGDEEED